MGNTECHSTMELEDKLSGLSKEAKEQASKEFAAKIVEMAKNDCNKGMTQRYLTVGTGILMRIVEEAKLQGRNEALAEQDK